jgi:uncharacterized MAPEG superfamily protein
MDLVAVVAVLALIEYFVFSIMTGRARSKYDVKAPATTGDPMFERYYRVQMNTIEQLVIFLPALFLFANYVSTGWAALLGLAFIVGRAIYARSYVAEPSSRSLGFGIGMVANILLLLGAFFGALL